ncbi:ABC transporter permease [Brucella pseudogrignonensis]|uniref:Amino ABC transporter, permease, 3-TM region, His/Glu/Gln/Arg/opine family domain protein n=1 Tax=Brucella pseudogrignonensis TaxID=419475 RepID=A0A256G9E8_9HYPH|nr:ABC transporter permease [Brucella pseudogrignonensis]OYR23757.1 amino ABC transporter, permease, 3-TM region, His/Glu/Gln/Arg/opine family domain protein [Brucella pseudogrignonensis]
MSILDLPFMFDSFVQLCRGIPLTLQLMAFSVVSGAVLATLLATMRLSGNLILDLIARGYIFVLRGTPLLVQLYIIYYGLSQFPELRRSFLWPFLRDPYWCAVLALALNTAAYSAEIIRGGVLSVAAGQIEAARAYGMSGFTLVRRILAPQALRQMLPAYSNEVILMVKSTALASTITMMEVTGLAAKLISATYRPVEVFICAGAIYLLLNFVVTRIFKLVEYRLSAAQRQPDIVPAGGNA